MGVVGLGDWGWGFGVGPPSPTPTPQSPIPNPQSPSPIFLYKKILIHLLSIKNIKYIILFFSKNKFI